MKVGITGHQNIGSGETIKWVTNTLTAYINTISIELGLTSLAIGADQLFAHLLQHSNIPYTVIIPCDNYERTFSDTASLQNYQALLNTSFNNFHLPFHEPTEAAFYQAGKEIVDRSDMIIAIWNGQPAKGLGGTGDIVKYAIANKKHIYHINPATQKVTEL